MKLLSRLAGCAAILAACAHTPAAPVPPCQNEPQWIKTDAEGRPSLGVYVCFGARGELLYSTRLLTAAQVAAITPATPKKGKTTP